MHSEAFKNAVFNRPMTALDPFSCSNSLFNNAEQKLYTYLEIWVCSTVEGAAPNLFE